MDGKYFAEIAQTCMALQWE